MYLEICRDILLILFNYLFIHIYMKLLDMCNPVLIFNYFPSNLMTWFKLDLIFLLPNSRTQ